MPTTTLAAVIPAIIADTIRMTLVRIDSNMTGSYL
jgi:hypothetical protein